MFEMEKRNSVLEDPDKGDDVQRNGRARGWFEEIKHRNWENETI